MSDCGMRELWYALRVKMREEHRVATALWSRGFQVLLPTCIEHRHWSDRVKTVSAALFPGYLFCRFDYARRLLVQIIPNIFEIVSFHSGGTPVDEDEIASLSILMSTSRPMRRCSFVQTGERVQITGGPLRGVTGIFQGEQEQSGRLIISITLLARSVHVELDAADVATLRPYHLPAVLICGALNDSTVLEQAYRTRHAPVRIVPKHLTAAFD